MGGSHYHLVTGFAAARCRTSIWSWRRVSSQRCTTAIQRGLVRACHDLSEGGLAVALAEMAFAGGVGADVTGAARRQRCRTRRCCSAESTTRFVIEVTPANAAAVQELLRRLAADAAGPDGEGAAAAHRRHERRVDGVGEPGGPEGGVAEAVAVVRGRLRLSMTIAESQAATAFTSAPPAPSSRNPAPNPWETSCRRPAAQR